METIITEKQLKTWVKPTLINMDLEDTQGGLSPSVEEFSGSMS
jgi:hypothetical protein